MPSFFQLLLLLVIDQQGRGSIEAAIADLRGLVPTHGYQLAALTARARRCDASDRLHRIVGLRLDAVPPRVAAFQITADVVNDLQLLLQLLELLSLPVELGHGFYLEDDGLLD